MDKSITGLYIPAEIAVILTDARLARNAVAHDLTLGMEGCCDIRIDEQSFLGEVSEHIFDLAHGDVLISFLMQIFNGEEPIRAEHIPAYREKILRWVTEK